MVQGQHPADALVSPRHAAVRGERGADRSGIISGRGGAGRGTRRGSAGGSHAGEHRAGRGERRGDGGYGANQQSYWDPRAEQGYGRPARGGRGGQAKAAAAAATAESEGPRLPYPYKVAQKLFTGEAELATEEPVYVLRHCCLDLYWHSMLQLCPDVHLHYCECVH